MSRHSLIGIQRHYRRLNLLFWIGIMGIILGPVLMLILAAVVYQFAGSDVSSPIGLSSPFAAVAAIALALLVRTSRKTARRSLEIAKWAESQDYDYDWKPEEEDWRLIAEMSVWNNPTSMKLNNLIQFRQNDVEIIIADFKSEHFYGAVTTWSEQTLVVFPDAADPELDLLVLPKGRADRLLGKFVDMGSDERFRQLPLARHFHIGCLGPFDTTELQQCLSSLSALFRQDPQLCLIVEQGHVMLFRQLQLLNPSDLRQLLATSWNARQMITRLEPV